MTETSPRPASRWWIWALGGAIAWTVYLVVFGPKAAPDFRLNPPVLKSPGPASRAEYHWTLLDLEGAPVEFSKFEGRTVFLNIWATWCPPCIAELPSIANLAGNARLKDVAFVCVATDESAASVRHFLRDKHWPMTVLRATNLPEVFMTEGIPATFLIARDGRIAASEVGAMQWDDPSVVDFLTSLSPKTADVGSTIPVKP